MAKKIDFSTISEDQITLFIVPAQNYVEIDNEILYYFVNIKKMSCLYIAANRPAQIINRILEKAKVNTANIWYIDCVSGRVATPHRIEKVLFLETPRDLTNMSIAITNYVKTLPQGNRLLFLDSLTTLAIHNDINTVAKFAHFIINHARNWGISMAIISIEEEAEAELINKISILVDRVVKI
ncbi:MAG: hypothetical protein QXM75_01630 [Candidatus Diapherotrites archaeon]